ncbi:maleylpyruvate isomerase N-terminal domain-containing protein [Pseudonocardia zijingensis]|jgi:uncharacterized protein (TIGR03083 family)|uniref:Mycothiol-dependent maleylpyruvate isomerase metal-binding domain-containing protein n=1 Tax=Pseudonocardia zijingensis TaxID=153376 RepID=A0ABN1Q4J5_9PSEU
MSAEWNFMDPASRTNLMRALRAEADWFFRLAAATDWEAPTACDRWQVRDQVGHMIDVTEGYFPRFDHARAGTEAPGPLGLPIMAEGLDEHARAFRSLGKEDALKRVHEAYERMLELSDGLTDEEWTGLLVQHPYMGPLPACCYPLFQLVDYTVHAWDIRERTTAPGPLAGDSADLLVPLALTVWQNTAVTSQLAEPFAVGVRVTSGANAGDYRFDCGPDGLTYKPASVDGVAAVLEYDPGTLVLASYGRLRGGTVRGDLAAADRFRGLFFRI